MRLDSLNGLLALLKVAEKKSFSAAAMELRVSPSALSQAVKQLEARLGVALLARTTRSTNLTEAGARFLERAGPALHEIQASADLLTHYAQAPSGLLRLTVPRIVYFELFQSRISGFMKAYPGVSVEINLADEFVDIVKEGFDAGIRMGESVSRDMTALRLSPPFKYGIAAAPRYIEKHGRPERAEELLRHDCILYRFADGEVYDHWELARGGKDFTIEVRGRLIANDPHVALDLAAQGLGLGYNSEHALAPFFRAGKLVPVLEANWSTTEGYFLYFPSRAQIQPKLRAFIDFFKGASGVKGKR